MIDAKQIERTMSQLAAILRGERERQGLSMTTVAERSGLSQPMVSLVERELRKPTLDTLLRLAVALDVDLPEALARAQRAARAKAK